MNCWAPIIKPLTALPDFQSFVAVENLYIKKPTAKKILKSIKSEPVTDQERQCLDHLKQYIRSLQGKLLSLFLQFITGSDIVSCESIENKIFYYNESPNGDAEQAQRTGFNLQTP